MYRNKTDFHLLVLYPATVLQGLSAQWVNSPAIQENVGEAGSIPGLGRSQGHGNSFQYSCLETPTHRRAWQAVVHEVPKRQTQLKLLSMHAGPMLNSLVIPNKLWVWAGILWR